MGKVGGERNFGYGAHFDYKYLLMRDALHSMQDISLLESPQIR